MNERKPNSLEELKQVQTKLQNALVKAEVVHATVGSPTFSRHLQTVGKTGFERDEAKSRVDEIRNMLEQNAIPHLTAHIDLTQALLKELELERPRLITLYQDYLFEKRRIKELKVTFRSHIAIGRLQPTALERIEKLEKEHTLRGNEPELLKAKAVWEESKAEEEKKEEKAVAAPKIEKPIKPVEPSIEERTTLPDGQDVTDILSHQERLLVTGLKPGSVENPITGTALSRFIFGNEVSLETGKQRLSQLLSIVKRKIGSKDWEVINKTTTGQHRDAEYYLSPMVAVTEVEKKPLPVMKINPETKEIHLEGWDTPKKVPGNISYAVLIKLAESSKENVPFLTLDTAAKETGSIKPDRVLNAIYLLRQLIEPDLNNPQLITKTGRGRKSSYCLNAEIEFIGEPEGKEALPTIPEVEGQKFKEPEVPNAEERTILPDGQDVTDILRPKEKKLVAGLRLGSEENPVSRTELTRFLYGNEVPLDIAKHTFSVHLANVRKTLDRFGWEIANRTTVNERRRGENSKYYLRPKMAVAEEVAKPLPVIEVDLASRKVKAEGWKQSKQIGSQVDWAVFQCLVDSLKLGKPIARSQKLEKAAWEAGSKSKHVVKSSVYNLRSILEPDPKKPQIIIAIKNLSKSKVLPRGRKTVSYRLNAQIEFVGKPIEEEKVQPAPRTEEKAVSLEEIDKKIALIEKAVATGAMPQSELDEDLRIRATFIDGAKSPETEKLPKMKIDESTRKVEIEGRVIQFQDGLRFDSLVHIARHPGRQISSADLKKFMEENGSKIDPSDLISHIRNTLETDTKNPQILKSFKSKESGGMIYRLAADIEFTVPEEELKVRPRRLRESKEIPLPDGKIVSASGHRRQTLEFFLDSPDLSAKLDDVSLVLFGRTDDKFRKRTTSTINDLNRSILEKIGWHYVNLTSPEDLRKGQKAQYQLEKIKPEIIKSVPEQPLALAPSVEGVTATEKGLTDNLSSETADFAEKLARARDLAKEGFISPEDLAQLEEDLLRETIIMPLVETAPRTIEEYDPAIKEDINLYLELIAKLRIWPINGQQLLQISPDLTWTFVSSLIDKEIVSQNSLNGRPMFTKSEVAVMLYAWEHGILPTKTYLGELQEIIKKEIAEKNKGGKDD